MTEKLTPEQAAGVEERLNALKAQKLTPEQAEQVEELLSALKASAGHTPRMTKRWPNTWLYQNSWLVQSAPGSPEPGAHAEVSFPGSGTGTRAYVLVTWSGGRSVSRTVRGDRHIRMVLEWVAEFNAISDSM